jgi:DNA-binding MarR family transcriptional regulator
MTSKTETPLSTEELQVWHALKQLSETALARVGGDIEAASGLSGADFAILSRLEDLGGGMLLQNKLARLLGWNKARLSHQLTRMQARELLRRDRPSTGRGVEISILTLGRDAIATARPVHAASIRHHLLRHLKADEARTLVDVVRRLQGAGAPLEASLSKENHDEEGCEPKLRPSRPWTSGRETLT